MELRHIRYFARAAELLHFTHAADSLYVSQPTLSAHIQQLEEELGIALFDRVGRRVQLTQAGNIFLAHAQRALLNLDQAKETVGDLKRLAKGTICVGALLTYSHQLLPAWIAGFHEAYPGIYFNVQTGPSDILEEEILSAKIDLALSFVPPVSDDISSKKLFTDKIYLVVGKTHAFASKESIEISALNSIPLALVSRRWAARRIYDAFFSEHEVNPQILMEVDDVAALVKIVSAGKIGALLTGVAVPDHNKLSLIHISGAELAAHYGVIWHKHRNLSPAASAFLAHISMSSAV